MNPNIPYERTGKCHLLVVKVILLILNTLVYSVNGLIKIIFLKVKTKEIRKTPQTNGLFFVVWLSFFYFLVFLTLYSLATLPKAQILTFVLFCF